LLAHVSIVGGHCGLLLLYTRLDLIHHLEQEAMVGDQWSDSRGEWARGGQGKRRVGRKKERARGGAGRKNSRAEEGYTNLF
jgi:hypothetical protein